MSSALLLQLSEPMIAVVAVFAVVLVTGGAIYLAIKQARKTREVWERLATECGLSFVPSKFKIGRIEGRYDRAQVAVFIEQRGSGQHQQTFTVIKTNFDPPLGIGLKIRKEGFMAKLGKTLGGQDIEFNDPAFDAAFVVKCKQPERALSLVSYSAREALVRAADREGDIRVSDDAVHWETPTQLRDGIKIRSVLDAQSAIARAIEAGR